MASRKGKNQETSGSVLVDVFTAMAKFEPVSQDNPLTVSEISGEVGLTDMETFSALDALADAELVESDGRGLNTVWWFAVPDVSEENAEQIAREALTNDNMSRVEYSARVAESQDMYMSQADKARKDGVKRIMNKVEATKAKKPVKAADGSTVTVPVDPENDPKGPRRELDADKGERVIKEEKVSEIIASIRKDAPKTADAVEELANKLKTLPPRDGLETFEDADTGDMVYESSIRKNGLWLDEPETVPERPEGVNANLWDLAHGACTQTARDYWMRRCEAQEEEHKANKGAPAPF